MLRDLTIQNYRCFKDFHIDSLARVNLIVGMNNSGKTSLLEAIYLLVNQGTPKCLADLLYNRGEVVERFSLGVPGKLENYQIDYQVKHLFHGHQPSHDQVICFRSQTKYPPPLRIYLQPNEQQALSSDNLSEMEVIPYQLILSSGSGQTILPVHHDGSIEARFIPFGKLSPSFSLTANHLITNKLSLLLTTNNVSSDQVAALWNSITLTPKEDKVVEALRIVEPALERISFTSRPTFNSGILLRLHGQYPIPLGSMGEGMRRLLTLAIAAVTVENGFLLVDEIETGLYYETQTDMWRLILEIAQQLNVQVFATTHSWDCISAFQEALEQLEDSSVGKLFRLSRNGENIRAVDYPAEKLGVAVRQSIEVR
jgi:energy-coupling factor transporter ATP-binding protein EcfA2